MKYRPSSIGVLVMLGAVALNSCGSLADPDTGGAGLANPASVYCQEQGGTIELRISTDGGQYGVCIFRDGSECEEWAFYRGECSPEGKAESDITCW